MTVTLHRNDPSRAPLAGNIKVTREDWLATARAALIREGADQLKVAVLAERMGVSRSSFYWYFRSREDLRDALLDDWQRSNTAALIKQAQALAPSITSAVNSVFYCVVDPRLFSVPLDFAIRDWAKRSDAVRAALLASDAARLDALTAMFERHSYARAEAEGRARVLYYMQTGYDSADLRETMEQRLARVPMYLYLFTGQQPTATEVAEFETYFRNLPQEAPQ